MSFNDGGHWYDRDGNSCHQVPDPETSDKMVNTTLKHARVLDLGPSVTSIQKVQNEPGINTWGHNKCALAGAENKHLIGAMKEWQWLKMVRSIAFAPVEDARSAGEQYHLVAESITNNTELPDYELTIPDEFFSGFCEWWDGSGLTMVGTEVSFAHPLGYGGRMDLVAVNGDERDVFADYKSKDTEGKTNSRLFFRDSMPVQLCAYMEGYRHKIAQEMMFLNKPLLLSVVISRDEPGRIEYKYWPEDEYDDYWKWFMAQLTIWKIRNKYDPKWEG